MRFFDYVPLLVVAALISTPTFADENASGGNTLASETVVLVGGPSTSIAGGYDHVGPAGTAGNSFGTAAFTSSFASNSMTFTGFQTEINSLTWANEADIVVTAGAASETWNNPNVGGEYTGPIAYESQQSLVGGLLGLDPSTAGPYSLEFIDTFGDPGGGAGDGVVDQVSTDVTMTLAEIEPFVDSDGTFAFTGGDLAVGGADSSVGEIAVDAIWDSYTFSTTEGGIFNATTSSNAAGYVSTTNGILTDLDTEIGLFDAAGILLAENDDIDFPGNTFSTVDLFLAAGDYTLVVGGFDTEFADGPVITDIGGNSIGDYGVNISLRAVPEPGSLAFLAMGCCGLLAFRRRK